MKANDDAEPQLEIDLGVKVSKAVGTVILSTVERTHSTDLFVILST